MVGIRQSVRVCKVGICTPYLFGPAVHVLDEGVEGAGYVHGYYVAGLIGGGEHRTVEQVVQAHGLAYLYVGSASVLNHALDSFVAGGDAVIKRNLASVNGLNSQQDGHDLGQRGRVALLVGVQGVKLAACILIYDDGGGALQLRRCQGLRLVGQGAGRQARQDKRQYQHKWEYLYFFHINLRANVVSCICVRSLRHKIHLYQTIIQLPRRKSKTQPFPSQNKGGRGVKKRLPGYEAALLLATAALICAILLAPGPEPGVHAGTGRAQEPFDFQSGGLININLATEEELELLPGIGPVKAGAIAQYRETYGNFESEYELLAVPGIGMATLEGLIDYICVEDGE